jgi:hypothetical protein
MGQALLYKSNVLLKDEGLNQFKQEHWETLSKYPNLQPVLNQATGNYYLKYVVYDVENLIQELSGLGLTKEMTILNIKKYGYQVETEYILNSLGFEYKSKNKIKVSSHVRKQAELFDFLFNINRECYIRLRNKSTGQYRAYSIETLKDPYRLQAILKSHHFSNNVDMMYSLNCYNNMYSATENSLFSLQNIAIDIDFDTDKYTLNKALELVKAEMGMNIPIATIIETGHRIRLLYTLQDVPVTKKSLKVYTLVASAIAEKLKELGASAQAPTTFGRIEGSINSKNGAIISNMIFNPIVYTLRELQNSLLPTWERAINKANKSGKVVKIRNTYTLNLDRLHDLEKIQTIRDEDYREILCYLYRNYCLLSNMTHDEAYKATLRFNSNFKVPLRENELDSDTKALNRKQYIHKSVTIIKLVHITPKEEEQLHLINIMSKKEYNRRDRVYQKNKYQEQLKENGKMSKNEQLEELRQKIKALRQQGLKNKEIMQMLGITSTTTFERHIQYLKKKGLL